MVMGCCSILKQMKMPLKLDVAQFQAEQFQVEQFQAELCNSCGVSVPKICLTFMLCISEDQSSLNCSPSYYITRTEAT